MVLCTPRIYSFEINGVGFVWLNIEEDGLQPSMSLQSLDVCFLHNVLWACSSKALDLLLVNKNCLGLLLCFEDQQKSRIKQQTSRVI